MRPDCRSGISAKRAWLSKRYPQCPAARARQVPERQRKSRRKYPAASWIAAHLGETALAAVRYAWRVLLHLPVVVAEATHAAMMPAAAEPRMMATHAHAALPAGELRKHHEAMFLVLIKALVERSGRIG